MSSNRPFRAVRTLRDKAVYDRSSWQVIELRRLQKALLKYSPQESEKIAKVVISKTVREVKAFFEQMGKTLQEEYDEKHKDPISLWTNLAADLISCEMKDYSEVLAEVMAIAGHLEYTKPVPSSKNPELTQSSLEEDSDSDSNDEHEEESRAKTPIQKASKKPPDYGSIYKYLAAVLAGEELPRLGKLECSIMADLLHGLTDTIRTHDSTKQQQIMLWKYHLLNSKIDINDTMQHINRCRKAVENDFSDFRNPTPSTSQANPSSSARPSTNEKTGVLGKRPSISQQKGPGKKSKTGKGVSDFDNQSKGKGPRGRTEVQSAASGSAQSGEGNGQTNNDKDGDKAKEHIPKKPALFTLNPFCVPIDLLKFQPLTSSKVIFKPIKKPSLEQSPFIHTPAEGENKTIIVSRSPSVYTPRNK